jgi:hypothetical protein
MNRRSGTGCFDPWWPNLNCEQCGPLLDGVKKWVAQGIPESEADQDSGHNIGDRIAHPLTTPQSQVYSRAAPAAAVFLLARSLQRSTHERRLPWSSIFADRSQPRRLLRVGILGDGAVRRASTTTTCRSRTPADMEALGAASIGAASFPLLLGGLM